MTDVAATPPATPDYPPHWEADVVASDGGTVHLRPILPTDADALQDLVARSSERTRYLRFFGPYPRIPERDLLRFVTVDHHDRVALVARLGHDIIAVGRYERLGPDEPGGRETAEVAFLVEDAHQGRGLGSILLEHLAAAGRERGIRRFAAEVLAENGGMVRIFLHAGYTASRSYSDGVVHLEFPIDPTAGALAVAREREQRAESRSVARLLAPGSVAVIGADNDPDSLGHAALRNLLDHGFQGPIYPVHPTARHVGGVPAYLTVLDVPGAVELAVLAVPPTAIDEVVEQCRDKGVHGLVVLTGADGGTDAAEELRTAARLVAAARAHGMRVVGPNCLGVVNTDPAVRLDAGLATTVPRRGTTGLFCQSAALGTTLLGTAAARGLGVSTFVSAGHRADLSGNDLLQFWATDPATDVVALYLESFGNPRKFARLARGLARSKPVVAVTGGRHRPTAEIGVELSEAGVQSLFEAAGVIRVETVAQLFDVALLLAHQPLPTGRRVAVVGNSSAVAALVADAGRRLGLLTGPSVDVGAGAPAAAYAAAVREAGRAGTADAVVAVFVPPLRTSGSDVARALVAAAADVDVPVLATFLGSERPPAELRVDRDGAIARGSVPSYPSPERAVMALAHVVLYAEWRTRPAGTQLELPDIDPERARQVVDAALVTDGSRRSMSDLELRDLLSAYGIAVLPERRAATAEAAATAAGELGYPVVLKATRRDLRHRADLGGVRLALTDAAAVTAAYAEMPGNGTVLVQPMVRGGVATSVSVVDDPSFGALVGFGVAGVASELLGDRAFRATPLSDSDAADLVRAVRAWPLLAGYRGAAPVDVAALEDLVLRVGRLAEDLPELLSLELEPVIVTEQGVTVAGAQAVVGPATARAPAGPRRMGTPEVGAPGA